MPGRDRPEIPMRFQTSPSPLSIQTLRNPFRPRKAARVFRVSRTGRMTGEKEQIH